MNSFFRYIAQKNRIILLLVLFVIFNVLFYFVFGNFEHGIPDLQLFYNSSAFYELIYNYSEDELSAYIQKVLLLDFAYPVIYSTLLAGLIYRFSNSLKKAWVAILIVFADFLENGLVIYLISELPKEIDILANIAGFATLSKWSLVMISMILLIFSLLKNIQKKKIGLPS